MASQCAAMLPSCENDTDWTNRVVHRREGVLRSVAASNNIKKCFNCDGQDNLERLVTSDSETGKRPSGGLHIKYAETNQEFADLFAEEC